MANGNWQGGSAKGRGQAFAWLRHNDPDHRKEVEHSNRDIDKSRTYLNFEVGPTKHLTYAQKCDRIRKIWDEWGYPEDRDLGPVTRNTPTSMQAIDLSAPDDLNNEGALEDGRLKSWAEKAVDEAAKLFGEGNIIAAYVDVDEQHVYTDAETGEQRLSRFHVHLYVAPVVEKKVVKNQYVYIKPDGTETLDESEAQRVYITVNNAETDDEAKAAKNDDGSPKTGPKHARMNNGRRKRKKGKRADATETRRTFSGAEFNTEYIERLNEVIHKMTAREFDGMKWNTHELGTYQRTKGKRNKSAEELKAASVEREVAQRRAEAAAEIEQNLAQSEALLDEAVAKHGTATRERDGYVVLDRDGEREMRTFNTPEDGDLAAFGDRMDRVFRVGGPGPEGSTVVEVHHAPRVLAARTKRAAKQDAKRVREAAEADAKRVREEAARDAQAVYDDALAEAHLALVEEREGDDLEAAHERHVLARKRADVAEREQLLDERVALVNERSDDVRRREDAVTEREAEATRLLDGYDREATIADFMPQLPPDADEGERAAADERARKAFAGACFHNGLKPPTVHVPGLREREAELTRQEQELVPLLKAVRAFIADPVTFVADALRRVQGYIAEVAHSEGTTRSQRLTNEMMNDAIADATRLMYAHPGDPRMREACAPDAPALREDERSGPVFDVDAWAEERRRKRAAKSAAKMTRQTLQQRLTQQPEQQSVREVWPESYAPKPRRGHDGPEL